jgi:hypothetical protein
MRNHREKEGIRTHRVYSKIGMKYPGRILHQIGIRAYLDQSGILRKNPHMPLILY